MPHIEILIIFAAILQHNKMKYLKFLPFIIVSFTIGVLIFFDYLYPLLLAFFFWLIIPMAIWLIVIMIQSLRMRNWMQKVFFVWGCAILLVMVAYYISPTRFGTHCSPDIMAKHYDKHANEIKELMTYTNQSLDQGAQIRLEFSHNKPTIFHVCGKEDEQWSNNWDSKAFNKKDSLMQVVGLDKEEFNHIRELLDKTSCISIEAHTTQADYTTIGFIREGMGMYSFIIFNRPMTAEVKQEYMDDPMFIPYNDSVVFEYGGGVWGPQSFDVETKEAFFKQHPIN